MAAKTTISRSCVRCARASLEQRRLRLASTFSPWKPYSTQPSNGQGSSTSDKSRPSGEKSKPDKSNEPGAMSRRLEEATEEALLTGGRAGRQAVESSGFSDELKERLLAKVKDAEFRSEFASAFSETNMPSSAGRGTHINAVSEPWAGTESTEDAVLRMLDDAHKPLSVGQRGRPKLPDLQPIDMRLPKSSKTSPGQKAANAKERASMYTGLGMKDAPNKGLSEEEREELRNEFRERFKPEGRAVPATLSGLRSLANERIEDAIARGQFKNIPRGKGIERDTRADNPFIDTTEYIMQKMIQRQGMVPPWVEKQQELVKTAHVFRSRLRNDWKRHVARMIASEGGSLEKQMDKARRYALAEEARNPRRTQEAQTTTPSDSTGQTTTEGQTQGEMIATQETAEVPPKDDRPLPAPYRDAAWLATEKAYMEVSIQNLNTLTRSYNLIAPELAKKSYYSLERELQNCYADVAPLIAETIQARATGRAKSTSGATGKKPTSVIDRFGGLSHTSRVYESKEPHYGLKEMWRDLFK